jgi:Cu/Zn superoxide dismutase
MGDLPNLVVDQNGDDELTTVTTRVTLSPSDTSVFRPNGTAVIIHALTDQGSCQPDATTGLCTGVSGGGRLACGVEHLPGRISKNGSIPGSRTLLPVLKEK